jgi:hypothetical protein
MCGEGNEMSDSDEKRKTGDNRNSTLSNKDNSKFNKNLLVPVVFSPW